MKKTQIQPAALVEGKQPLTSLRIFTTLIASMGGKGGREYEAGTTAFCYCNKMETEASMSFVYPYPVPAIF